MLGQPLAVDRPLVELATHPIPAAPFPPLPPFVPRAGRATFFGEVFLGGGRVFLGIWWDGDRAWLEVDHTVLGMDLTAGVIEVLVPPEAAADRWLEHVLLGPPLLLALAQRGVFALHAGAVEVAGRLLVFVGASGAGKSTLAGSAGTSWQSFADDLLPVEIAADGTVRGLGGFPQLKLAPAHRRAREGETLPLAAVVLLDGEAPEPILRPLPPAEAAATWVAHTMIARLFSPRLLADHLAWATRGA
ncbi:MAG: hypothetical protein SF066_14990, partial [Thermoanaerobaculia bacterium]|nr:hypothetical protein [Thermoanaerobaculia bacterium]